MSEQILHFDEEHVLRILEGEKHATVRVSEEYASVESKDWMKLVGPDGEELATGRVYHIIHGPAEEMLVHINDTTGHKSYEGLGALLTDLRRYYPDEEIGPKTILHLIEFNDLSVNEGYRDERRRFDARRRKPSER